MIILRKIEKIIVGFLLLFIVILVFLAAVLRWFGVDVAWSIDMAQLIFVWSSFLGADIALYEHRHIGVDFFERRLPKYIKKIILMINYCCIFGFLSLIAYYGAVLSLANFGRLYNSIPISYSFATMSAPVSCFLMALTIIGEMKILLSPPKGDFQ